MRDMTETMKSTVWTEERIDMLRQCYMTESNEKLANRLGISSRTLRRKAVELGLRKIKPVTKSQLIEEQVRELYPDHSLTEIGDITDTSWRTIQRMVNQLGLSRTKEQDRQLRSKARKKLIKSERSRIAFGLDQRTNIKLVTNRERIRLRTKLKKVGYIVLRGDNTIYYTPDMKRHPIREEHGRKVGLSFAPECVCTRHND